MSDRTKIDLKFEFSTWAAYVGPMWNPIALPLWPNIGSPCGTLKGAHMGPMWVAHRLLTGLLREIYPSLTEAFTAIEII